MTAIRLDEKFQAFDDLWSPKVVTAFNDYELKIAKVQGEFTWHQHDETDEVFLVHRGRLTIQLSDGSVELGPGDLYVVPRGIQHRPVADELCEILLIEPAGTVNTGDAGGGLTAPNDDWI